MRKAITSESISVAIKMVIQFLNIRNQANLLLLRCVVAEVCSHCTLRAIVFQTYKTTVGQESVGNVSPEKKNHVRMRKRFYRLK